MNKDLSVKLGSLPERERNHFYARLIDVLNDRYSCFKYGSMNNREYASMPKEKLERLKINLYHEMFENIVPPSKILVDLPNLLPN
jgi:uncharacterized protein (UPF0305 family)